MPAPTRSGTACSQQAELNLLSDTAGRLVRGAVRPGVVGDGRKHLKQRTVLSCTKDSGFHQKHSDSTCACMRVCACVYVGVVVRRFLDNCSSPFGESLNSKRYLVGPLVLPEPRATVTRSKGI